MIIQRNALSISLLGFLEMLDSADGCLCVGRHILRMLCVVLTHGL